MRAINGFGRWPTTVKFVFAVTAGPNARTRIGSQGCAWHHGFGSLAASSGDSLDCGARILSRTPSFVVFQGDPDSIKFITNRICCFKIFPCPRVGSLVYCDLHKLSNDVLIIGLLLFPLRIEWVHAEHIEHC